MLAVLRRRVPLVALLRDYPRHLLRGDLVAGLTTAVMLVPQAMAYASLAGMPPITGLYASIGPIAVYALLGTSGSLAFGPVAIVALLTASAVAPLADGDPATYVALAGVLALMVGAVQLLLGILRLGVVVDLLSHAVISGFTSAAALIIAMSQLRALTGLTVEGGDTFLAESVAVVGAVGQVHPATLAVGATSIAILLALKRSRRRIPGPLVVVVVMTVAAVVLDLGDRGVALLGAVPSGLPAPGVPRITPEQLQALVVPAVTIALLSFMEGISVAKAIASRTGDRIDSTQELIASGAANVAAGLFQAFPVAGGFSRTAVNFQAGARTPLASLVTAAAVLVSVLLLTPLFTDLPKAVLAAIVVVAVMGLVDVASARHAWRTDRWDFAMLAITFVATLGLGVEAGIGVGVASSLVLFIARNARPHIAELGLVASSGQFRNVQRYQTHTDPRVLLTRIDGALLFASAQSVIRRLEAMIASRGDELEAVVLDASAVADIDGDGVHVLDEFERTLEARSVTLHLATVRGPVRDALERAGRWRRWLEADRIHEDVEAALRALGVELRPDGERRPGPESFDAANVDSARARPGAAPPPPADRAEEFDPAPLSD
jgi:sulfate permease, SulP family